MAWRPAPAVPALRQSRPVGGRLGIVDAALASAVPGFVCIDHLGIAVPAGELEAHVRTYLALGFTEIHREDVHGADQVREVSMRIGDGPNLVQLLEPLAPTSPIAAQLARNGGRGGLAHVALRVIDAAPRPGSRGTTVFFVHPKTTDAAAFGYVLEVVQEGQRDA